jgi:hypothetical protein
MVTTDKSKNPKKQPDQKAAKIDQFAINHNQLVKAFMITHQPPSRLVQAKLILTGNAS